MSHKDSEESNFETFLWSHAYLDVSSEEKDLENASEWSQTQTIAINEISNRTVSQRFSGESI